MKNNKKLIAIFLILSIFFATSYAYFDIINANDTEFDTRVTTNTVDSLMFYIDSDITVVATAKNFGKDMDNQTGQTNARAVLKSNNKTNNATKNYNMFFIINENELQYTENENTPELLLQVTTPTNEELKEIEGLVYKSAVDNKGNTIKGFDITSRNGTFKIARNYEITSTSTTTHNWNFKVIFVNLPTDQTTNGGKKFNAQIIATQEDYETYKIPTIDDITYTNTLNSINVLSTVTKGTSNIDKYYYAIKTTTDTAEPVESEYHESLENSYNFASLSAGTNYNVYSYVTDEYGTRSKVFKTTISTKDAFAQFIKKKYTGVQGKNNIYYHKNLANSAEDGSYRYAGPYDSVNNYVCFGSGATTCPHDNLYRIIGVFGNQVKLIKADYAKSSELGTSGDYNSTYKEYEGSNNYGTNKGSNAKNQIGIYYWNRNNGTSTNSNIWANSKLNTKNLNDTYLNSFDATWQSRIAFTAWKVGGNAWNKIGTQNAATAYQNEIVSPSANTVTDKKIGLMYVSDYMYGASPNNWTKQGYNGSDTSLDYRNAIGSNWMYNGLMEWTISRNSDCDYSAFYVNNDGYVGGNAVHGFVYAVRPCFYLNASVSYVDGNGTQNNPYRIS